MHNFEMSSKVVVAGGGIPPGPIYEALCLIPASSRRPRNNECRTTTTICRPTYGEIELAGGIVQPPAFALRRDDRNVRIAANKRHISVTTQAVYGRNVGSGFVPK